MTTAANPLREYDYAAPPAAPLPQAVPVLVAAAPVPVPVLGPFVGLVGAVLSALVGGWLLLAPFAFDYRAGAPKPPRPALIDLSTGAAAVAIGLLAALLFATTLVGRLRPAAPQPAVEPEPEQEPEPEPESATDLDGDLRDLLAPLVLALTADLRGRQDADQ